MRVRFLNEYLGDTSLTVLEVGAMRLEDTPQYGKCVILDPIMDRVNEFYYYSTNEGLVKNYDIISSTLLQRGFVDLLSFKFKLVNLNQMNNNYQNTITDRNVIKSDSCIIPPNMLIEDEIKELQEKELAAIRQEKED